MKTPMVSSATSFQRLQTSLQSPMPRLPRSNVYSTRDPANPSASVHRKRFFTPSLTLKFLCAGCLNPGKENDGGKGAKRTHRVAESQSQQGVGGNWRINYPPPDSVLSKRNWDAICFRALSWRSPRSAGFDGRSDRLFVPHTGFPAACASREHKSLCGDTRHTFGAGA